MQFYQFEYYTHEIDKITGNPITELPVAHREWFGAERDAVKRRLELWNAGKLTGKKKDHTIWPVDVPTRKEDLLAWLNRECV